MESVHVKNLSAYLGYQLLHRGLRCIGGRRIEIEIEPALRINSNQFVERAVVTVNIGTGNDVIVLVSVGANILREHNVSLSTRVVERERIGLLRIPMHRFNSLLFFFLNRNTRMSELFRVIVAALGRKERTAKVYAATIRRIHREVYKKELEDKTFAFLRLRKTYNYVSKIVNLTRRKNAATAILVGLQATKAGDKVVEKFRAIMMDSDRDYQSFLTSGQRKRPFADAEKALKLVTELHKKANQEITARRLWDVGSHVSSDEYKVLMAWIYLKWISALPPRRLEYSNTRLVTPSEYSASGKTENCYE